MRLLFTIMLLPFLGFSQTVDIIKNDKGQYEYQEVIYAENASKEQIYNSTLRWAALHNTINSVSIEFDDFNTGKIICFSDIRFIGGESSNQTIQIDIKEGKYRVSISDFVYSTAGDVDCASTHIRFEKLVLLQNRNLKRTTRDLQELLDDLHKEIVLKEVDSEW